MKYGLFTILTLLSISSHAALLECEVEGKKVVDNQVIASCTNHATDAEINISLKFTNETEGYLNIYPFNMTCDHTGPGILARDYDSLAVAKEFNTDENTCQISGKHSLQLELENVSSLTFL